MLPQLQAEEQLARIEAASVPNMKQEHADQVFRRYQRAVRGPDEATRAGGLHEALMAAGVRVVNVPKAVK